MRFLYQILTDFSNIVLFFNFIMTLSFKRLIGSDFDKWNGGFLLAKILFELLTNLRHYFRVRKMELSWSQQEIMRISQHKNTKALVKVKVMDLRVGDIIMIKNETICPADVLILCTSERLHSQMILYTNERKITGNNKISVKNSIRNLAEGTSIL